MSMPDSQPEKVSWKLLIPNLAVIAFSFVLLSFCRIDPLQTGPILPVLQASYKLFFFWKGLISLLLAIYLFASISDSNL